MYLLQVLDVIIGWVSSNDPDTITAGRSFYFYDEKNHYLGGGAEAWSGYSQVDGWGWCWDARGGLRRIALVLSPDNLLPLSPTALVPALQLVCLC